MKTAFFFAAFTGVVLGMLLPGSVAFGLYLLVLGGAACARYGLDWGELKADRRRAPEPVQRERRRRDYEVGR
jgi:hypothetical protein